MKNKLCSIIFSVAVFFFIITFSIGLPIYFRPFYYAHINALNLTGESGFTKAEIKEAYNEVLDYLTIPGKAFGTGVMRHSESGASHFADCKALFDLNASVLIISSVIIVALIALYRFGKIERPRIGKFNAEFWSALAAIILPLVLGGILSVNFTKGFMIFHKILFPDNQDWLFDPIEDQIISVLPQPFFMNCAILIACGVLVFALSIILKEITIYNKRQKNG